MSHPEKHESLGCHGIFHPKFALHDLCSKLLLIVGSGLVYLWTKEFFICKVVQWKNKEVSILTNAAFNVVCTIRKSSSPQAWLSMMPAFVSLSTSIKRKFCLLTLLKRKLAFDIESLLFRRSLSTFLILPLAHLTWAVCLVDAASCFPSKTTVGQLPSHFFMYVLYAWHIWANKWPTVYGTHAKATHHQEGSYC